MRGMPWRPVPGRDALSIPANTEENGTIIDENGNEDGYVEENTNHEERFNPGIDDEQDEDFARKSAEEEQKKSSIKAADKSAERNSRKTTAQQQQKRKAGS